jgi:hypothetical protein
MEFTWGERTPESYLKKCLELGRVYGESLVQVKNTATSIINYQRVDSMFAVDIVRVGGTK